MSVEYVTRSHAVITLPNETIVHKTVKIIASVCVLTTFLSTVAEARDKIDYGKAVRPILSDRCFHCHGPDSKNQESDYRMDSEDGLLEQIEPNDLENSEVYQRIISDDPDYMMPPPDSNRSLWEAEKDIVKRWIEQGATYQGHWAFELPKRPEVPKWDDLKVEAQNAQWGQHTIDAWSENPIDAFIARRLIEEKLKPAKRADLETRKRRAALTLTGLLPSPAIAQSDDDYGSAVNLILDSDDYAERQALRWLDSARYADTDGYQNDYHRENWPWRDWVIKAYRDNMPFDEFSVQQIAGDMIEGASDLQRLASAFNRNHRQNGEGGALAEEFLVENVIDRVETTSTVFLGLTFGCARCHDHKYDPLPQEEFFQLYGYFNNIGEKSIGKGVAADPTMTAGSPLIDVDPKWIKSVFKAESNLRRDRSVYKKRLKKWTAEMTELVRLVDQADASNDTDSNSDEAKAKEDGKSKSSPKNKTTTADKARTTNAGKNQQVSRTTKNVSVVKTGKTNQPTPKKKAAVVVSDEQRKQYESLGKRIPKILRVDKRDWKRSDRLEVDRFFGKVDTRRIELNQAVKGARSAYVERGGKLATVMVMKERTDKPQPIYLLDRGQYNLPQKDKPLRRGIPNVLLSDGVGQPKDRYEFAKWLVSKDNPLTARVIVNRMWRDHFGTGLVKTVDDFGVQGEAPSHGELLDWLAVEFMDSGWDVKAMQRLIVTSQAYQQSSRLTKELLELDPDNRLLARGPRYRADGFSIRDIALQAAGLLNTEIGGPPVKPYQPDSLWEVVAADKGTRYVPDKGNKLYRKSMYSYWKRAVNPPRQTIFDAGGREVCCVQVRRTNTPLQALVMMNDKTFVEAARMLAEQVLQQEFETDEDRLSNLYQRSIGRSIDEPSMDILKESLAVFRAHYRESSGEAEKLLSVGAHHRDESLETAEHAAMTMVAHMVMNLDEFLTVE